jgi:diaminopimelate epimerase
LKDKFPARLIDAELPFTKMQGLGNDFVLLNGQDLLALEGGQELLENWSTLCPDLAKRICDRRYGVGADGLLLCLVLKDARQALLAKKIYGDAFQTADLAWSYTNSDGSFSATCGNGLRCITKFAYDRQLADKAMTILTFAGLIEATYSSDDQIAINFGSPLFAPHQIPFLSDEKTTHLANLPLTFENGNVKADLVATMVNVGNPHCVVFADAPANSGLEKDHVAVPLPPGHPEKFFPDKLTDLALAIQKDKRFPEGTNVEFVWLNAQKQLDTLVYERGCGPTLACGSAAAAVAVAASLIGKTGRSVAVNLPGGRLALNWRDDDQVILSGPARQSFSGTVILQNLFDCRQPLVKREVSIA